MNLPKLQLIRPIKDAQSAQKIIFRCCIVFYILGILRLLFGGISVFSDTGFLAIIALVSGFLLIVCTVLLQKFKNHIAAIAITVIIAPDFIGAIYNFASNFKASNIYTVFLPILIFFAAIKAVQAAIYLKKQTS